MLAVLLIDWRYFPLIKVLFSYETSNKLLVLAAAALRSNKNAILIRTMREIKISIDKLAIIVK
jgi:hypothetical protein